MNDQTPAPRITLSSIHDFSAKLRQPDVIEALKAYVTWQAVMRGTLQWPHGCPPPPLPQYSPVSINLDITTACNFACDHCVDMDILNSPIRFRHDALLDSLALLAAKGLRSVIVIGGGEPTVYPRFEETIRHMKALGLQVAIVSNGSRMRKILAVADCLGTEDWVRLSLDAGSDALFQRLHRPKQAIGLDEICDGARAISATGPRFKLGYSYIVTWRGAHIHDLPIAENIGEIVRAAVRARDSGFDYIAYKPFLTRAIENRAEVVDLAEQAVLQRIGDAVLEARTLETPRFRVYETTNLKAILAGRSTYTQQPHDCHMQFFRQVLSPLGIFNCPVYRNLARGKLGSKDGYATQSGFENVLRSTARLARTFDAATECKQVTCLYHDVNWWIEDLIAHPQKLGALDADSMPVGDYFL